MRRSTAALMMSAFAVAAAFTQAASGEPRAVPEHGRIIAQTWCAACHSVSPDQTRVDADVPTFASIAKRLPADADILAAFIANPHPPMPNMGLSRQDIQDLLGYIATLK